MVDTGGHEEAHHGAQGAGEDHGADDDPIHLDAGIAGGALALTHHGDLIAVLAVLQIDEHKSGHKSHDQNGQKILITHCGQPASVAILIDNTNLTCALRHFPDDDEIGGKLHGNVVHHQGEQGLVGVPLGLEEGGQEAPDGAGHDRSRQRDNDQHGRGYLVAQQDHAGGGGQAADHRLTLGADVPKAHLEGRGNGQRKTQQNSHITEGHADAAGGSECTGEDGGVHINGVFAGEDRGDQTAENQSQQKNAAADEQSLGQRQRITLGNMEQ